MTQPRVAASAAGLTELLAGIAHVDGDAPRHRRRARASATRASATSSGAPRSARTRRPSRPPAGSSGRRPRSWVRRRRASMTCTWPAAGARCAASRCRPSTCGRRCSTWPAAICRGVGGARLGRGHLRARAQRAGVHLPAPRRVHHERPRGRHRGRLAGSRVRPGRPLPVQRQEVRGRPRGRHRDAPQGHASDALGGRLRQHRHRLLDARGPVARPGRRAAAHQLPARRRAVGAHPGAPGRTASWSPSAARSARWARRTPPRRSCAPTSTAIGGSSTRARVPTPSGLSKVSVQTGTSHGGVPLPGGGVAEVKLDFGTLERLSAVCRSLRPRGRGPARRLDAARRAVPPLPQGGDRRDPPRDRLPERALRPPGVPAATCARTSSRWCYAERRRRARGGRDRHPVRVQDPQEGARRPTSARCGSCRPRTPSWPRRPRTSPTSRSSSGVQGSKAMVEKYVTAPVRHRPRPDSLRG